MINKQAAPAIMMVRPLHFGYNEETAASNAFQVAEGKENVEQIRKAALAEFDHCLEQLDKHGVQVLDFLPEDQLETTDEVFPNNWVSFHQDGTVIIYPMLAISRRHERRMEFITCLEKQHQFAISRIIDLSHYETQGLFLEGTGSMVLDYVNKICYANTSARTHTQLLEKACEILDYQCCVFRAVDENGQDIYHTNVLMCVAHQFAVICLNAIANEAEREQVVASLEKTGHEIVEIDHHQMSSFAGNMMEVMDADGQSLIIMSQSAHGSLTAKQLAIISGYSKIVTLSIPTIEKYAGGSVRCMMAGIFLPKE